MPVLDFSTLPPVIGQVPTTIQQKVQSEVKSMGDEMLRNVKTATKNPLDFKISMIKVPKANVSDVLPTTDTLKDNIVGNEKVNFEDPADVSAASESLLVNPSGDKMARRKQDLKRQKFYEDNLFESYAYSAQLQAQLAEMPQVLDDLITTATSDADENQAFRANYTARQTMSKLLGVIQRTKATQLQLYAAKDMGVNIKPRDAAIVAPALGKSLVGVGSSSDALDFAKGLVEKKKTEDDKSNDQTLDDLGHISEGKTIVQEAVEAHNMVADMQERKKIIEKHKRAVERHDNVVEQLAKNESCNKAKLATYYGSDASKVWSALTGWSSDMYSLVKANAALPEYEPDLSKGTALSTSETKSTDWAGSNKSNEDKAKASTAQYNGGKTAGDLAQQEQQKRAEAYARLSWDVGRKALIDLYDNQSKWGKSVKDFDPWEDQKTIYKAYLSAYYGAIKARYLCMHGATISNALSTYLPTSTSKTKYKIDLTSDNIYYEGKYNSYVYAEHQSFIADLNNGGVFTYSQNRLVTNEDGTTSTVTDTKYIPKYTDAATITPSPNCSHIAASSAAPNRPESPLPPYDEIIYLNGNDDDYMRGTSFKNSKTLYEYSRTEPYVDVETLSKADKSGDFDAYISANIYKVSGGEIREVRGIYPETPSPWAKMFAFQNSGSATSYSSDYFNNYKYLSTTSLYDNANSRLRFNSTTSEFGAVTDSGGYIKYTLLPEPSDIEGGEDKLGKLESNRISVWLGIKENEAQTKEESDEAKLYIKSANAEVASLLSRIGYNVPADFDLSDENDYNIAIQRLKQYKNQKVSETQKEVDAIKNTKEATVSQRLEELKSMLAALKTDKDEALQLSYSVAKSGNLAEQIKESEANKVAVSAYEDSATDSKKNENYDPMCEI